MSVLGTEIRLRRWVWAAAGCAALTGLAGLTKHVEIALPISLRLISAPEVIALIAVALGTHPLLDRLPQLSATAVRERALRPVRAVVSLLLVVAVLAPAARAVPHLLGFGLGMWAVTVLVVVAASGTMAWMVPVLGGMAIFVADGGRGAPISTAIATPAGTVVVSALVLLGLAGYCLRGPRSSGSAHA